MPDLLLTRNEVGPDGTFGVLTFPLLADIHPKVMFFTMEDDWLDNKPSVSCIPVGTYRLHRTVFHKHGYETFEVTNVLGRDRILIHPANTEEDVEGCIGLGMRPGRIWVHQDEDTKALNVYKRGVVSSQIAFRKFMDLVQEYDELTLQIVWRLQ